MHRLFSNSLAAAALAACLAAGAGCVSTGALPPSPAGAFSSAPPPLALLVEATLTGRFSASARALARDPDPEARRTFARIAGRLEETSARPELERLLAGDPDAGVRAEAAFALGLLGDPAALPALGLAASDADTEVRARVAAALGLLADGGAVPILEGLLQDREPPVLDAACRAAGRSPEPSLLILPLLRHAGDRRASPAAAAAEALASLARATVRSAPGGGPRLSTADLHRVRDRLLELERHPVPAVRAQAARGLVLPSRPGETEALRRLIRDRDPWVRAEAARSLAYPRAPLKPYLDAALQDPHPHVRAAAVEALAEVGTREALDRLVQGLATSRSRWLRTLALRGLGRLDPSAARMAAARLVGAPEPALRAEAAAVLRRAAPDASTAAVLAPLRQDPNPAARAEAFTSSAELGLLSDEDWSRWVADPDPVVRMAAARAVVERLAGAVTAASGQPAPAAWLEALWNSGRADTLAWVPRAVLDAVSEHPSVEIPREWIEEALDHPDPGVRLRARSVAAERFPSLLAGHPWRGPFDPRLEADPAVVARWAEKHWAARITVKREGFQPGRFTLRLHTRRAPLTCWNFARLAEQGFFNGLEVHRVLPAFALQDGDPRGDGYGGPGWSLPLEISPETFLPGSVGMAAQGRVGHAGQWFVVLVPRSDLDGAYTQWAEVVQNLDGVAARVEPGDRILDVEVYAGDGTEPLPPLP